MKKMLTSALVIILALLVVLSVAKDTIAKVAIEKGVEAVTGVALSMKNLSIGIINTRVGIKGLMLFNPKGYKDRVMLDMPEIYVDYDLPAIFKGKVHLEEMRIDLSEFMVVKNENGDLNINSLKVVKEGEAKKEPVQKQKKEPGKAMEMQIDSLSLKIGKVIYKDYSQGGEPKVQEFDININEKYQDINDPAKLVQLIIVKALMNTTIARLTNFDLQGLQGELGDTLKGAQQIVGEAAQTLTSATEKLASGSPEAAGETVKETAEALKDTAEDLKDVFKNPFASKK